MMNRVAALLLFCISISTTARPSSIHDMQGADTVLAANTEHLAAAFRGFRILTDTPTDRLGQLFTPTRGGAITSVKLLLARNDFPVGNIWVTIQTGSIGPDGVVLGTSAQIDVSTVSDDFLDVAPTTFIFASTIPVIANETYFVVLHGDYPRSNTDGIAVFANAYAPSKLAYQYDGATVVFSANYINPSFRYNSWWHQIIGVPLR